ncbi:MAG: tRNA lysidine(34) synthetase TilS [Zoogloeaceae bacterium]|jgi:tRNA(Ile)-lysidine synthase|nr:tRNA lysidine(34) synthetase TilS [Zoogloeaceae bacterium]
MANTRNSSPPADLAARVSACLAQHVRDGGRLAVALSGGVDSVSLLHVLRGLPGSWPIRAVHVNHGLSPNADRWQTFCERLCEIWGIPFEARRVEVDTGSGDGLEAAARKARYAAFAETDAEWLLLGHHRDDQIETLLLNLLRGAGVSGAAAMPMARPFHGRSGPGILRPFLDVPRAEIERHARAAGLSWVDDESNAEPRLTRNFLRRDVLPLLRERFPGCDAALARAAAHFAEGEHLLRELAGIDAAAVLRQGRIVVARLAQLDDARARNLFRYVLRHEEIAPPDDMRLREIARQVCAAAPDRHVRIALGGKTLYRYKGEVWLLPDAAPLADVDWRGEESLAWGERRLRFIAATGAGISLEKLRGAAARITARRGGERLQPDSRRPRRALKKLLQESGVPPWERGRMPLLWCDGELVWAAGIGIDSAWQCAPGEPGIVPEIVPAALL